MHHTLMGSPQSHCCEGNALVTLAQASNQKSLDAAVEAAAVFLNGAVKPVLVAGGHLRTEKAMGAFAGNCTNTLCTLDCFNLSKGQKLSGTYKGAGGGRPRAHRKADRGQARRAPGVRSVDQSSVRGGAWLAK